MQKTLPAVGVKRENIVFVSGIGCSSRFPYYMNNYGMHTLHGRAPAFASGLKVSRPELQVWIMTGDGDALAIGGNHFIHVMRRNLDVKIVMFNNRIYGLTKGQVSPTSELGKKTKSTPHGSPDYPFNPPRSRSAPARPSSPGRSTSRARTWAACIKAAAEHKGTRSSRSSRTARCSTTARTRSSPTRRSRPTRMLRMEQGKPLLFGKDDKKGLRFDPQTAELEVVTIGENGVTEKDILVHDAKREDPTIAFMLAN